MKRLSNIPWVKCTKEMGTRMETSGKGERQSNSGKINPNSCSFGFALSVQKESWSIEWAHAKIAIRMLKGYLYVFLRNTTAWVIPITKQS